MDINGQAFDLELVRWRARWAGRPNLPTTLSDTLHRSNKDLYPNICKILTILLCMPVTTATAERSFSAMKRIKTFLRASMSDSRISSLAVIHIHRDTAIDVDQVIDKFRDRKSRKLAL